MKNEKINQDEKLNIIFASHTHMGGPFVVGSHHLARELSVMGHNVIHMSSPITPFHLLKRKDSLFKDRIDKWIHSSIDENKVLNYIPMSLIPWSSAKYFFQITKKNCMLMSIFPSFEKKIKNFFCNGRVDVLIIDQPTFVGIEKLIKPKLIIYRPTDLYVEMTRSKIIEEAEKEILKVCNGLIGTSYPVTNNLKKFSPLIKNITLENGVEYNHFVKEASEPIDFKNIIGPKAIYVGAIDERLDLEAIKILAIKQPNLNIIIIGPYNEKVLKILGGVENIYLLGSISYKNIPDYLNNCDIGLLPLSNHEANNGRSPMKLYEYAASGLPVVVKKTKEIERRKDDFIHLYNDTNEFTKVVEGLMKSKINKNIIKQSAMKYSWTYKADVLLKFIYSL
jgi:glycosyltransferase involved in cell wall biosynthesis